MHERGRERVEETEGARVEGKGVGEGGWIDLPLLKSCSVFS